MRLGLRSIVKEVGIALAVLAMYSLLLLAPWHQASALQHELAELGYATVGAVDLCGPIVDGDDRPEELGCHIAGIGKLDFSLLVPDGTALVPSPFAQAVVYAFQHVASRPALAPHFGQARAPPVSV